MTIKRFMKTTLLATLVSAMLLAGLAPVAADITPGGGTACLPDGVVGTVTCDLYATTGTIALPGGGSAPVWGYADAAPDAAQVPGPTIVVDEGDTVTINLTNNLSEDTALWFPQLPVTPDLTGIAAGGTTSYSFVASAPGTFLYEAGGATGPHQVAMGMSGAIVVVPTGGVVEDNEHLVAISELDLDLLNSTNPASFDLRDYGPDYQIVNGSVAPAGLPVLAGETVRLRYLNVGLKHHSIGLLGLDQHVVWMDGFALPAGGYSVVSESLAPGQTAETIVSIPTPVANGTKYALYEGTFLGGNGAFGGMLTYLEVVDGTPPGGGGTPPVTTNVVALPTVSTDGTVVVTADIADPADSDPIDAAELFIDASGADGTGIDPDVPGTYSWKLTGLTSGQHNVYVHGEDDDGWGTFAVASFRVDVLGPVVSGLSASPNPSSGLVNVSISATANDTATGGSGIVAAEYQIDGETAIPMAVNPLGAPIASLDAVISAVLSAGPHTLDIRAQDSAGHWGPPSALTIDIDQTGPATSAVLVRPGATNGFQGYTPTIQSIRVDATFTDTTSNIAAGEGFINTVGLDGTGFPMTPADGLYNETIENGYVYIPLTTIRNLIGLNPLLSEFTIYAHGVDSSGNWGATQSAILTIDKGLPTISTVTVTPDAVDAGSTVALTATADDGETDIVWAEWFAGADPGEGNGVDMLVTASGAIWDLTATIDTAGWATGDYTISARARDAAGNWSAVSSDQLNVTADTPVVPDMLDFSTVGGGNNNSVPNVAGPYDDADVYSWDTTVFSRILDGSLVGLPGNADIDGLTVDASAGPGAEVYYVSFNRNAGTNVPNPPADGGFFVAQDEDVVLYDAENGEWQPFFDGAECLLDGGNGRDIDAFDIVGANLYFSTSANGAVEGAGGPYDDADVYVWDGASCSRIFDASANSLDDASDIDGLTVVDNDTLYVSFDADTTVPVLGAVQDEDVVLYDAGAWSLYFDGTAQGLTTGGQDLDAINVR
jgi:FtsP/CotA-like multicopper oxidase with cupredoxin domain